MTEEELKAKAAKDAKEAIEKTVGEFKESLKGYATTEGLKTALAEFKTAMESEMDTKELAKQVKELNGVLERQAIIIEQQKAGATPEQAFSEVYKKFFEDKVKLVQGKQIQAAELHVKDAVLRSAVVNNPAALIEAGVNRTAVRKIRLWDLIRNKVTIGRDNNGTYGYYDENVTTRAAASIAENGTYPESKIAWIYKTLQIRKVGDSIPVSWESLRDVTWIESELRIFLAVNVDLIVDNDVLNGDGTGEKPTGLNTYAQSFTDIIAADYAVKSPSIWNVARAMKTHIEVGKDNKYLADVVAINPLDYYVWTSEKDTLGQPIRPAFVSDDFTKVDGMDIFVSSVQTKGTVTVFCNDQARIIHDGEISLEVGRATGDWENDRYSLKARKCFNVLIKDLDASSIFKTTDLDATITAMTKVTTP